MASEPVAGEEHTFVLQNETALIPELVGALRREIAHVELCDADELMRVGVALEEALSNAMHHGNLEVGSDVRDTDLGRYYALIEERARTEPYCARRVNVTVRLSADEFVCVVRDEGAGFDPSTLKDPADPAHRECLSGRGLMLIRAFMDEVRYNDAGNEVTMVKRRSAPPERDGLVADGAQRVDMGG